MTHEIIYEDPRPRPVKEVVLPMTPSEFKTEWFSDVEQTRTMEDCARACADLDKVLEPVAELLKDLLLWAPPETPAYHIVEKFIREHPEFTKESARGCEE